MEADIILYLRHLRHDLLNTLMVVDGYLQMGNSDKARQAIEGASRNIRAEGDLLRIVYPSFALALLMSIPQLYQKGVTLTVNVTTDLAGSELEEETLKLLLAKLHSLSEQLQGYSNQWGFKFYSTTTDSYCWRAELQGLEMRQLELLSDYVTTLTDKLVVTIESDAVVKFNWAKTEAK